MKKAITIEEAKKVIAEYPDRDDYVNRHYVLFLRGDGEPDDNTIQNADYWDECKKLTESKPHQPMKHEIGFHTQHPKQKEG